MVWTEAHWLLIVTIVAGLFLGLKLIKYYFTAVLIIFVTAAIIAWMIYLQ